MARSADPVLTALTGPGAPFEIVAEAGQPVFRHAPPTLGALIDQAQRFGAQTALVDGDLRLSYAALFARRDALAGVLKIAPGERVAIAMRNGAPWMIALLAVVRAGAVAVLVNSRGAGPDLRAAIETADAALVLADAPRAAALRVAGYAGRLIEAADFPSEGHLTAESPSPAPDDPAAILFTSGATGRAKGAVLSHRNLVTGLMCVQLSGAMVLQNLARQYGVEPAALLAGRPQSANLLVFPLFHVSGLAAGFLSPLVGGGKIVVLPRWDVSAALALIAAEQVTALSGAPTMLWDLVQRAPAAAELGTLGSLSIGGQGLPLNLLHAVRDLAPQAMVGAGFGLTETAGAIAMAVGEDFLRKPASSGRILPLAEVRVLDDAGKPLPEGAIGEIAVRGAMVMSGYWRAPDETAAVLDAEGWFRTGDIGFVDDEGYIFIVDRKKDMVLSGGENIYCAEVERVIGQLAPVLEVAAFGVPDPRLGEALVAVVVAEGLSEDHIREHVAAALARYKAPTRVAFTTEPLPRNAVGKIDKALLRASWPLRS